MADAKERAQIRLILSGLPGAAVHPVDWEADGTRSEYLYRQDGLLVRTEHAERVTAALHEVVAPRDDAPDARSATSAASVEPGRLGVEHRSLAGGMSRLDLTHRLDDRARLALEATGRRALPHVPDLLERLDAHRGVGGGIAHPATVVYGVGYGCPATEPEEVSLDTRLPWPTGALGAPGEETGHGRRRGGLLGGDGAGVRVAVLDTGLSAGADTSHAWLSGVTGEEDPHTTPIGYGEGHGTFAAGVLRSVAPRASVHVYRVLTNVAAAYEDDVVHRLHEILTGPDPVPDVLLVCFATASRSGRAPSSFEDLHETVLRHHPGLVMVAPAGNDSSSAPMFPAALPWVVSVGALDTTWQQRASFSNHGDWVRVYAPGEDLVNAFVHGAYECEEPTEHPHREFTGMARWSGTSFSAPVVAGMIAARASGRSQTARQAADDLIEQARRSAETPGLPRLLPQR